MSLRSDYASQWIDLRDARGRLLARYDPARRLLHIRTRGQDVVFDLSMLDDRADPRGG